MLALIRIFQQILWFESGTREEHTPFSICTRAVKPRASYLEFSWGVVVLFYVTGRLFSYAWRRRVERGGLWEVIYLVMVMLGIYLATQSYTAWAHRLMYIGIPTVLVWRYWIMRDTTVAVNTAHRNAGR